MSGQRPPSVACWARARAAPDFIWLWVDEDWQERLHNAREELRRGWEVAPALALPIDVDPALFRWPVRDRHVLICGPLDIVRLRRLLGALLRDGAVVAAGEDTTGAVHMAALPIVEIKEDAA